MYNMAIEHGSPAFLYPMGILETGSMLENNRNQDNKYAEDRASIKRRNFTKIAF